MSPPLSPAEKIARLLELRKFIASLNAEPRLPALARRQAN